MSSLDDLETNLNGDWKLGKQGKSGAGMLRLAANRARSSGLLARGARAAHAKAHSKKTPVSLPTIRSLPAIPEPRDVR